MKNIILIVLFSFTALFANFIDIPVTRDPLTNGIYPDLDGHNSLLSSIPANYRELKREVSHTRDNSFLIVVETSLYPLICSSLDTYMADLILEGYSVYLLEFSGGSAADLRTQLIFYYQLENISGVILIGYLPYASFEMFEDFNNNGIWDPDENWVTFPCDLYFADLDGFWIDGDNNGVFDIHSGNMQPELFIGRIRADNLNLLPHSAAELINSYFERNHLYRRGQISFPSNALAYIDDDWSYWGDEYTSALQLLYDDVTLINEINSTYAADYHDIQLQAEYEFIQVHVHSGPDAHHFYENNGSTTNLVTNSQIAFSQPNALFYNLFACSNSRFTTPNNMGAVYIFGNESCLATIGATKTGSMLFFEDFYGPLGQGANLGEALRLWWQENVDVGDDWMWQRAWFYGNIIQGDPTLRLQFSPTLVINIPADYPTIQEGINAADDGDLILVQPGLYLENIDFSGKNITLASLFFTTQDTSYVSQTIIDGNQNGSVVTFAGGETSDAILVGFTIQNGESDYYGAGIKCQNSSPTLRYLKIDNNQFSVWGVGGGIYFEYSDASLSNIEFSNNLAQFGGCIYADHSDLSMTNVSFLNNHSFLGGGIYLLQSDATISNAVFAGNVSSNEGGAIWLDRSHLNLINATVASNSALNYGGGVYLLRSSVMNVMNSIFWQNDPQDICFTYDFYYPNSTLRMAHSNLAAGMSGIVTNNNGYVFMLEGNIFEEPGFISSEDFHLADTSLCIGAGIEEIIMGAEPYQSTAFDIEGNLRPNPVGSMPDLGAYENPLGEPQTVTVHNQTPMNNLQISNYPNPFNLSGTGRSSATTISFSISTSHEFMEIVIYNLKGQKIKTLPISPSQSSTVYVIWDGTDQDRHTVSSGVYLYQLQIDGQPAANSKMLLIK